MRGTVSFDSNDSHGDAARYIESLRSRLELVAVGPFEVHGLEVDVRAGFFRPRPLGHPFLSVTSAKFRAVPNGDRLVIEYEVRMTELVVLGATVSLLVGGMVWGLDAPLGHVALALAFFLGTSIGLNTLSVVLRIRKFLRSLPGKSCA
jgi:hypothetical protein